MTDRAFKIDSENFMNHVLLVSPFSLTLAHCGAMADTCLYVSQDQPLLRLPHELMRKNFRTAHFNVDKTHVSVSQAAFPNQNGYPASRWNIPLTRALT